MLGYSDVTYPETCKLISNDTEEGVAEERPSHWPLRDATDEDVNIVHVFIQCLQLLDHLWGMNGLAEC